MFSGHFIDEPTRNFNRILISVIVMTICLLHESFIRFLYKFKRKFPTTISKRFNRIFHVSLVALINFRSSNVRNESHESITMVRIPILNAF